MPRCGILYVSEPIYASDNTCYVNPESTCALSKSWWLIHYVVTKTQNVTINKNMIKEKAKMIIEYMKYYHRIGNFWGVTNNFQRHAVGYPMVSDERVLDWLFVLNALNFNLWRPKNAKQWTVNGLTGYMALCYAVKRAINEGYPLWSPKYYSTIKYEDLQIIFRSDDNETMIPALKRKEKILHKIGKILLHKYQGTFKNCVSSCDNNSHKLLHLLLKEFKPFRDKTIYKGHKIYIGCKAITLISDLWFYRIIFPDTRFMISTMFVDHRAPEVLVHLGILRYSSKLITKLAENKLTYGSKEELEIRCCSLIACRMLLRYILTMCESYTQEIPELKTLIYSIPILIDNFLWHYRHTMDKLLYDTVPYHYVRSLYY